MHLKMSPALTICGSPGSHACGLALHRCILSVVGMKEGWLYALAALTKKRVSLANQIIEMITSKVGMLD